MGPHRREKRSTSMQGGTGVPVLSAISIERRPALAAIVAERIRDAIVFGELALGEAISEERLATQFGVSRTPVREALSLLQLQGLVDVRPQRGSFVAHPTVADIEQLCQFRSMLETGALRLAFNRDATGTLHDLKAAQDRLARAEDHGDWIEAARADDAFHGALFRHCGNHVFAQAYDLIAGRIGAARFFARQSQVSKRRTGIEHRAIIKAFGRGSVDVAADALREHIEAMPARFAERLRASSPAPVSNS